MARLASTSEIEYRAVSAYLGLAIGDALGATVEFMSANEIASHYGLHDQIRGGGWLKLKAGDVTDDTTMSLALGKSILQHGGVDAEAVAEAFSQWYLQNPVDVGNTVKRGIIHFRYSGVPYVAWSEQDAGNGACMRTLPVALATFFCDEDGITTASREQAHVTHNNVLSDTATECVINMLHLALRGGDKAKLLDCANQMLVQRFSEFTYLNDKIDNPSGYIVETLRAVLQAFNETDSFEQCLVNVVNRGGDADTTGAIVGMLAGAMYGVQAIPRRWVQALDPEVARLCRAQALQLIELATAIKARPTQYGTET